MTKSPNGPVEFSKRWAVQIEFSLATLNQLTEDFESMKDQRIIPTAILPSLTKTDKTAFR
jgi:hypothetical protein